MRFLIADDHALFANGFALLIGQLYPGAHCAYTHDFKTLLSHAEIATVDLLFLDWHMPGMQGIYSIKMLQQSFPGLPICVISADESRTQLEYILRTGISGFIPKSVQAAELKSAIDSMLGGEVYSPLQSRLSQALSSGLRIAQPLLEQPSVLTTRQMQILSLLVDGNPNKLISQQLGIQESTLKTHIKLIFKVLEARNRTEAVCKARRLGLVD